MYVILQVIILDRDKLTFKHQGKGSDLLVTFDQIHCVLTLLMFS